MKKKKIIKHFEEEFLHMCQTGSRIEFDSLCAVIMFLFEGKIITGPEYVFMMMATTSAMYGRKGE